MMQRYCGKALFIGYQFDVRWVLSDNLAYQFYAALGGKPVYETELEIGGKSLIEIAYGWTDTATLRSSTPNSPAK